MMPCERTRELIPWYVDGSLDAEEVRDVANHVATCDACLREVAAALRIRIQVRDALDGLPKAEEALWARVKSRIRVAPIAVLDVGSFFLGFRLGASVARGAVPVRGDLRVLGRNINLFDRTKGGQG